MVELMFVFLGVVTMLTVLLSYNNVVTLQRINNDLRNEIVGLHDDIHNLEFELQVFDETCNVLEQDLCILGEAVDNYLESFEPHWLENLIGVMDELEEKYGEVEDGLPDDFVINTSTRDGDSVYGVGRWDSHVSNFECVTDCPICLEAEQTPVEPTLY